MTGSSFQSCPEGPLRSPSKQQAQHLQVFQSTDVKPARAHFNSPSACLPQSLPFCLVAPGAGEANQLLGAAASLLSNPSSFSSPFQQPHPLAKLWLELKKPRYPGWQFCFHGRHKTSSGPRAEGASAAETGPFQPPSSTLCASGRAALPMDSRRSPARFHLLCELAVHTLEARSWATLQSRKQPNAGSAV